MTGNSYQVENGNSISLHESESATKRVLKRSWKLILAIIIPIALIPLLTINPSKESRCGYVLVLMALYWMFEPIPLAATALMPMALYPLFGILSTSEASEAYMKSSNAMFIGGLFMAIAIEKCNLHKRIALRILMFVGTSLKRIMVGLMLTTMFLSMWISNTATTAMMVPIIDAMLEELGTNANNKKKKQVDVRNDDSQNNNRLELDEEKQAILDKKRFATIRKALLLSVAYSANIGGTGTITGTGTNLVLTGFMEETHPASRELTFSSWFVYAAPGMLICVLLAWIMLYVLFLRGSDNGENSKEIILQVVKKRYAELGELTFQEKLVVVHFLALISLWFFRSPSFVTGWADLIESDVKIKDGTPAILIAIFMFLAPANLEQFYKPNLSFKKYEALLDWNTVHQKMPWGVVLLLGGGFALADGTQKSGLSVWLGAQLSGLHDLEPRQAMVVLVVVSAMVTEVASNVATASVLLPVVDQLAIAMHVNPLLLMLPVTIGVSFAFMFPVATPPNAIVFEHLGLKSFDMIKPGLAMNILCIGVELFMINTWGRLVFDLDSFPDWANRNTTITTHTPIVDTTLTLSAF